MPQPISRSPRLAGQREPGPTLKDGEKIGGARVEVHNTAVEPFGDEGARARGSVRPSASVRASAISSHWRCQSSLMTRRTRWPAPAWTYSAMRSAAGAGVPVIASQEELCRGGAVATGPERVAPFPGVL
jgi:hypothetical protein